MDGASATPAAAAPVVAAVEGPAFPLLVKLLASVMMAALLVWGLRVADEVLATSWSPGAAAVLLVAIGLVVLCYYWILRSRTTIDATHIRQTWMWNKEVALSDVAHIKFIAVPYMSWLIAPRMVIRARGRGVLVFHTADPEVLRAFARLTLGIA
ncbi:MAG: hypothetical protein V4757_15805 [Pseudomonadota bacterium]